MNDLTLRRLLGGLTFAGAMLLLAAPASAVGYRLDFSQADAHDGDPAAESRASAVLADVPGGVALTLRLAPGSGDWRNEHLQHLWLNYGGDVSGLSVGDKPRVVNTVEFGQNAFHTPRTGDYDIHMSFNSSGWNNGQYRLDGGEDLRLVIQGASADQFMMMSEDGRDGDYYGLVKVANPGAGNSIRMGALEVAPVPLPGAALLFAPAILGLAGVGAGRRRRATTPDA